MNKEFDMKRMHSLLIVTILIFSCIPFCHAKININTASAAELQQLPNIGEGLARVIVNYRETHGPFSSIEAIMNVPRIGAKTFTAFKDQITVGPAAPSPGSDMAEDDNSGMKPISKYTAVPLPTPTPEPSVEEVMQLFAHEPDVQEVQKAAVKYAHIDPLMFKIWRDNAKKKALLPESFQVSVGHDTDDDTDYARSKSISLSGGTVTVGPDDEVWGHDTDSDWDYELKMKWNLQDYMFNTDMLRVSAETEDQVELRQDILNDVTKLYFDRRRLQVEAVLDTRVGVQQKMNRTLRLDELTAIIDGMTGGYFSQELTRRQPGQ